MGETTVESDDYYVVLTAYYLYVIWRWDKMDDAGEVLVEERCLGAAVA